MEEEKPLELLVEQSVEFPLENYQMFSNLEIFLINAALLLQKKNELKLMLFQEFLVKMKNLLVIFHKVPKHNLIKMLLVD
ncbi:hypothetical protein D3C83_133530 [compost metagenome]